MNETTPLGQIADPDLERAFLAEDWETARTRMRFICLVTSILYVLAAIADYGDLGPGPDFRLLLWSRAAIFLCGMGCVLFLSLRRDPGARQNLVLCVYMSGIMACECLELALKGTQAGSMSVPGTVFIVLAYYLFMPARLAASLVAGIGGSIAYLFTLALATPAGLGAVLNALLFFVLANVFGIYFVINFGRSRRREFLSLRRLRDLAHRDELTGVDNRRKTLESGEKLFRSAIRYDTGLSVLMLDVDRFKEINDRHGHAVGDAVLVELAARCVAALRDVDVFGRLGGEEFCALLPHSGLRQALTVAERIRTAIQDRPFDCGGASVRVTVSIGAEMLRPGDEGFGALLRRADKELYAAKHKGRNRVSPEAASALSPSAVPAG